MKRTLLAGVLCATASAANAVDIEVAVGAARYNTVGDGFWYQEGFPHRLNLTGAAAQIGLTGEITSWLDWGVGYAWLGRTNSTALAVPDASDYPDKIGGYDLATKGCYGGPSACGPKRQFSGSGSVQGFYATLRPHVDFNGWRFGIEAGPFLYYARWNMTAINVDNGPRWLYIEDMSMRPKWAIGSVIGVSISRGPLTLQYQRFFDRPPSDEPNKDYPALWRHTDMLSLKYRF